MSSRKLIEFWELYSEFSVDRTLAFKEFWEALFNSKPYGGEDDEI